MATPGGGGARPEHTGLRGVHHACVDANFGVGWEPGQAGVKERGPERPASASTAVLPHNCFPAFGIEARYSLNPDVIM